MSLVSGIIPYQYVVPVPVKGQTHAPGNLLQPSGLLFEQAAWVLMAELRRYITSGIFDSGQVVGIPSLNNFPDPNNPQNLVYDPTTSGKYLAGITPAFLLNLTNIGSIRKLMTTLFFGPAGLGGLGVAVAVDWFTETFKNHPRGTNSNPFFNQDIFAHPLSQQGTPSTGVILTNPTTQEDAFFSGKKYYPLGSSGILYDIDLSELMYQPWPRLNNGAFNAGVTIFQGASAPLFPQFQKTNGGFIAVSNANKTKFWQDGHYAIRGDILIPGTEVVITTTNDFSNTNIVATMSFVEPGLASLPAFNSNASTIAEAAYTPQGLSSNTYRIAVRLPKNVNSNIAIPSGIRTSVFPSINLTTLGGLHVFDDAIFLESNNAASVLSPLTLVFKHDCLAELESIIGTPVWSKVMGLARLSANNIVKTGSLVQQTNFDSTTGNQDVTIGFPVFDDVVNRTSNPSGTFTLPTDDGTGSPPFTNPDTNSDGVIAFTDLFMYNGNAYLIEDGFGRIHEFTGPPLVYNSTIFNIPLVFRHGASINGDIWTFGNFGDNRFQNITAGGFTLKTFDVSTNFPAIITTDLIIHSVIEITGATFVTNGIYVFWSARTSSGSAQPRTYRLSIMSEQPTTFQVDTNILSQSTSTVLRPNTHIWWRNI